MAFSDPYFVAGQIVIVNAANTAINSVDDLKGKKVGAQIGTSGAVESTKIQGAQFIAYDSLDPAIQAVMTNQIDAVIADNPLALGYVAKNPARLKTAGKVFTDENDGIAVCPRNTDLLAKINKGLADIKADGKMDAITQTWMGK
jgi:polar amino acid transport system substrate-binding protein